MCSDLADAADEISLVVRSRLITVSQTSKPAGDRLGAEAPVRGIRSSSRAASRDCLVRSTRGDQTVAIASIWQGGRDSAMGGADGAGWRTPRERALPLATV
jgi:hypothetical protein